MDSPLGNIWTAHNKGRVIIYPFSLLYGWHWVCFLAFKTSSFETLQRGWRIDIAVVFCGDSTARQAVEASVFFLGAFFPFLPDLRATALVWLFNSLVTVSVWKAIFFASCSPQNKILNDQAGKSLTDEELIGTGLDLVVGSEYEENCCKTCCTGCPKKMLLPGWLELTGELGLTRSLALSPAMTALLKRRSNERRHHWAMRKLKGAGNQQFD